ncbi:hypothetical protein DENSPDRAFT_837757 [Dentipellis sp. KUC8613]|nr:hypothetical protein DENSPDRAFT_837757 [Dentipellis sp. KUC8613]
MHARTVKEHRGSHCRKFRGEDTAEGEGRTKLKLDIQLRKGMTNSWFSGSIVTVTCPLFVVNVTVGLVEPIDASFREPQSDEMLLLK